MIKSSFSCSVCPFDAESYDPCNRQVDVRCVCWCCRLKSSVNPPERSEATPAAQQMPHPLSPAWPSTRSCFLKCGTGNLSRSPCSSLPRFQLFRVFSVSYSVRLLTLRRRGSVLGRYPTLTPLRGGVSLSAARWTRYSTLMPAQLMSH